MKRISSITVALLFFLSLPLHAEEVDWGSTAQRIEEVLNSSMESYRDGRVDEAKKAVTDAYFNLFEGEGMETAVRVYLSEKRVYELEAMFRNIRSEMTSSAPVADVAGKIDSLVSALREDAERLPERGGGQGDKKKSPYASFFNSFIIILREGFEAILVISALTAYLAKTGHQEKVRVVYQGAATALIASVLTAVLLQKVIKISGAGQEALEGITMLFATAVLFYVSYWLISKIEVSRWQQYVKSKVDSSISKGSVIALGFAAFLAVYREGAETILFYQALYSSADSHSAVTLGFAAGTLPLIALFFLVKYGSVRIPITPFFAVTSALLYYLAFTFAGKGVLELQEAEWVSSSPIEGFPAIALFGIYPTWEGILLQSALAAALVIAVVYSLVFMPHRKKWGALDKYQKGVGS